MKGVINNPVLICYVYCKYSRGFSNICETFGKFYMLNTTNLENKNFSSVISHVLSLKDNIQYMYNSTKIFNIYKSTEYPAYLLIFKYSLSI